jgi:tRNA(fMet)-specific endonuclease VapC
MKYLLDTNICNYIINENPANVLMQFEQHPVTDFGLSSVTHAELQYGVEKSRNRRTNQYALDEFLLPLTILPFHGKRLVTCYGEIRASLESEGRTIGPLDVMIAAHAISLDLTMISNNLKEFSRIPNLKCENWI